MMLSLCAFAPWRETLALVCLVAIPARTLSQEPTPEGISFFEKKVRPLLVERCLDCHTGDEPESGLSMDSLAGLQKGGLRGPAIVTGEPEQSLLVRALRHGEILKMPPKEKLPPPLIADIATWIKMGAPWPNAEPVALPPSDPGSEEVTFTEEQTAFWSFQPPRQPAIPEVQDRAWVRSPIDAFIRQKLETAGFQPAPQAAKRVLIRRATFDLTGLPPTPEEVDAFVADESPHAFARLIDRLLNSPGYGERWGRHWLDVARYADSNGLDENLAFANAFHYRDYVVAAFNKDKPFDCFVQEQIAGDLLVGQASNSSRGGRLEAYPSDWDASYEGVVATGFLALGAKMLAEDDPVKMQMDIIDEQVDTLGRAFIGMTFGCARCHDHKFDPIPTADYYALAGIFKSTKTMENFHVVARWQEKPLAAPEAIAALDEHTKKIEAKQTAIDKLAAASNEAVLAEARQHVGDYLLAATELARRNNLIADATVYGDDPDSASLPNALLVEADEFDRGNVLRDRTNWGKGIGVLVNAGETPNFAEYDIEVKAAGLYQIEIRVAAAAARPTMLVINGQLAKRDAAGTVTGSWYPDGQKWFVEGFYHLNAGKNVIRLEQPQFFPHIDKILFLPASGLDGGSDEFAPLGDYEPKLEFVQQWSDYLQKTKDDPASPFADWHAAIAKGIAVRELAGEYNERAAGKVASGGPLAAVVCDPEGPFKVTDKIEAYYALAAQQQLASLRAEKKQLDETLPKFPEAMAVSDAAPENIRIHYRGSHLTQGRPVPRRIPRIFTRHESMPVGEAGSGRLELARWLTRPDNPLTARVIVNRMWLWHFGEGLVRSPDNFGKLGRPPTHPELLDWLAVRFVESGWSIKQLHRTIMLSSTYQMSTALNEPAAAVDPENELWWRFNRRRLEAESIRDSILAVAGQLDLQMGGSMLPTKNRAYVTSTANVDPVAYETNRRSIYMPVVRSALYDVFQAFDFAEPSVSAGQRQSTTVAPQALFMMNSKVVADATRAMAEQLLQNETVDDTARVILAYRTAYGRSPNEIELQRALAFVEAYIASLVAQDTSPTEARIKAWQSLCRVILSANEFIYVE